MIAAYLNRFLALYSDLGGEETITEYRRRSFVLGKPITVIAASATTRQMPDFLLIISSSLHVHCSRFRTLSGRRISRNSMLPMTLHREKGRRAKTCEIGHGTRSGMDNGDGANAAPRNPLR